MGHLPGRIPAAEQFPGLIGEFAPVQVRAHPGGVHQGVDHFGQSGVWGRGGGGIFFLRPVRVFYFFKGRYRLCTIVRYTFCTI